MSSTMDQDLTLSTLPSDVVRKIFKVGQESIESMRLIIRRWNDVAIEHLSCRRHLPVIEKFSWKLNSAQDHVILTMRVAKGYQRYFGVQSWRMGHPIISDPYSRIQFVDNSGSEEIFERHIVYYDNTMAEIEQIRRLFSRASRIRMLEPYNLDKKCSFEMRNALGDIVIEGLSIDGCQDPGRNVRYEVLDFIVPRGLTIQRLFLCLAVFITEATKYVGSLVLTARDYLAPLNTYQAFAGFWEQRMSEIVTADNLSGVMGIASLERGFVRITVKRSNVFSSN